MQKGLQWVLSSPEYRAALRSGDETAITALKETANGCLQDFNLIFGFTGKPDPEIADMLFDYISDAVREPEATTKSLTTRDTRPEGYYDRGTVGKEKENTA